MRFLFPSNYFNCKQVDDAYAEECDRLQSHGFETSVISLENLEAGTAQIDLGKSGERIIYRGWMLDAEKYWRLQDTVRASGAQMWIDRDEYLRTHYLPNWYPLLQDLTPETHIFSLDDDLEIALKQLGWSAFFIKDYVKSLKTSIPQSGGCANGSFVRKPEEINTVLAEMQKFRGTIEGGICVRKVEDFIPITERRYFMINGRAFAAKSDDRIPEIVTECAHRIDSKFFAVDVIDRVDGCERIVEIGDGQVSGLVGWSIDRFAQIWMEGVR